MLVERGLQVRMVDGNAHGERQVIGSDHQRVEMRHLHNRVELVHGRHMIAPEILQTTFGSAASSRIWPHHGSRSPCLMPGLPRWSSTKLTSGQRRASSIA